MNDQHAHAGYTEHTTGSYGSDPLFGSLPEDYASGHSGQYDSSQWSTAAHPATGYDAYATAGDPSQQPQYEGQYGQYAPYEGTGQWDAGAWNQASGTGRYETAAAAFPHDATAQWASPAPGGAYETGAYDATAWNTAADPAAAQEGLVPQQYTPDQQFAAYATPQGEFTPGTDPEGAAVHQGAYAEYAVGQEGDYTAYGTAAYDAHPGYEPTAVFEAASYDAVDTRFEPEGHGTEVPAYDLGAEQAAVHEAQDPAGHEAAHGEAVHEAAAPGETGYETGDDGPESDTPELDQHNALTQTMTAVPVPPAAARPVRRSGGGRGRRRTPAKRSALLTVAVPSVCVLGAAGIAAASVGDLGSTEQKDDKATLAAPDPASAKAVAANSKMDTQLAALSADARDFGDRASRTQERIDLKARQAAEKKKREEEAARREAMRPKFLLPVKQDGLSAYYGQSGVNWMSLHTGIDFPVQYGTPVMAATDGTVRTQWNSAYGNMAIVTAPDGTETWYCHLSTTKIRSGSVKAGDVIAFSGNSGNSTGPHLHFEVRPGGGSAVDPLAWLRSHGLDPT
ncbi:peptidoglycan DD-metalloendopeptidase family protein [Streptomyces sp. NPDC047968]|uniref:peptidoglycan DD-metalloendopeptidase family protein n=1 Tax=unclassified Streptomyces TaxID=2593676 RepID=UPI0034495DD2